MKDPDFMEWLETPMGDEAELDGKLEKLALDLSDLLRECRQKAGLSQKELGEKMGLNQPAIAKIEDSSRLPLIESVVRQLHHLGYSLEIKVVPNVRYSPFEDMATDEEYLREAIEIAENR